MISTLLQVVGIDLKRLARNAAITIVLATFGAFAASLAFAFGAIALYFWLELQLGTFATLSILGGTSALLAILLFVFAFRRAPRKPSGGSEDALRAAARLVQTPPAAFTEAADEAVNAAAEIVRNGSPQQIAVTLAVAALIGWQLGRRF
jgi:hypothetical protein